MVPAPRGANPESPLNPMVAQNHTCVDVLFLDVHILGLFSFSYRTDPFIIFLRFLFCIGVQLVDNVVLVSGEQRRDSAIHIHVSNLPQSPFPSRLPHDIEQSSIRSRVGPWFSIVNIAVCTRPSQTP